MQLPIASNYNILIADKRGKMVVVECTPNIKKIGEAKSVDDGYLVCTVNSFISDKLKPYDFAKGDDYHSYTRYSVVMDNCINNVKNNDPVVETQKLLKGEYGFMCQYDDEPDFETIALVIGLIAAIFVICLSVPAIVHKATSDETVIERLHNFEN